MMRSMFGKKGFEASFEFKPEFLELTYRSAHGRKPLIFPLTPGDKATLSEESGPLLDALLLLEQFSKTLGREFNPDIVAGLQIGFEEQELTEEPVSFAADSLRLSYPFIYFIRSNENLADSLGLSELHLRALGVPAYERIDVEIKQSHNPDTDARSKLNWSIKTEAHKDIADFKMAGSILLRTNGAKYLLQPEHAKLLRKLQAHDRAVQTEEYKNSAKVRLAEQGQLKDLADRVEARLPAPLKRQRTVVLEDMSYEIGRGVDDEVVLRAVMPQRYERLDSGLQDVLLQSGDLSVDNEIYVGDRASGVRVLFSQPAIETLRKIQRYRAAPQEELEEVILDPARFLGSEPRQAVEALYSERVSHLIFGRSKSIRESSEGAAGWAQGFEGNSFFWQDARGVLYKEDFENSQERYQQMKSSLLRAEREAEDAGRKLSDSDHISVIALEQPVEKHQVAEFCKRVEAANEPSLHSDEEVERAKDIIDKARLADDLMVDWQFGSELRRIPVFSLVSALPRQEESRKPQTAVTLGAAELNDSPPPVYLEDSWDWENPAINTRLQQPAGFREGRSLRPHQVLGASWLLHLFSRESATVHFGRGALLADDMGVGKTVQILAFLSEIMTGLDRAGESILIISPVSLIKNAWLQDGFRKFFNNSAIRLDGFGSGPEISELASCPIKLDKKKLNAEARRWQRQMEETGRALGDCDIDPSIGEPLERFREWMRGKIILCSYETLRLNSLALGCVDFRAVILDEAQKIKNEGTLLANAAKSLKSRMNIAMSGTPIENSILDLWNLVDFVSPGKLGSKSAFRSDFLSPLKAAEAGSRERRALREELERRLSPIWLRRTKADVFSGKDDLPAIFHCDSIQDDSGILVNRHVAPMSDKVYYYYLDAEAHFVQARGGHRLPVIQTMLQLCLAPWLRFGISATWGNSKELFSLCPKLRVLFDILEYIYSRSTKDGRKALIFCNLIDVQNSLAELIEDWQETVHGKKIVAQIFNGQITSKEREKRLSSFIDSEGFQVMILSPRAGGVGLNLQEANHVIHYTREWNPAIEKQATARAYRYGQQRSVHVYYPTTTLSDRGKQSAEELLANKLLGKRDVMDDFTFSTADYAVSAEDWTASISTDPSRDPVIDFPDLPFLSPDDFERLICCILTHQGYTTDWVGGPGDDGVDVVALSDKSDIPSLLIQAKHTANMGPGISKEAIQEVRGGKAAYTDRHQRAFKLVAVTNYIFSTNAMQRARYGATMGEEVELWDRDWLRSELDRVRISRSMLSRVKNCRL